MAYMLGEIMVLLIQILWTEVIKVFAIEKTFTQNEGGEIQKNIHI